MRQALTILAALLLAGCSAGTDSADVDLAAMKQVIREKNDRFTRAHVTGDRATIDGMFTYGNEDLLIDQGDYVLVYGEDNTEERGKYLNVWKREDGGWKVRSNIWNTDGPQPSEQ